MRRVVIGFMVVLLVGCVALVGLGMYFGVPLVNKLVESGQENVIQVMQDSLYHSSSEAIAGAGNTPGTVRIRDRDLTVNNTAVAGEAGWETGTSGTVVYGFDVWFTPDGVHLGIGNEAMYSGMPTVVDGRLELLEVRSMDVPSFISLMSADDFEQVIEWGLNEAFAAHDLVPTDLTLDVGEMVVNVSMVNDPATASVEIMHAATVQTLATNLLPPEGVSYENTCDGAQAYFDDLDEAWSAHDRLETTFTADFEFYLAYFRASNPPPMVEEWSDAQTAFWAVLSDFDLRSDPAALLDPMYSAQDDLKDACGDHEFTEEF